MNAGDPPEPGQASQDAADAALSAALFAIDPVGLGGVILRAPAGPAPDGWLALLRGLLPQGTPWRRVPLRIDDTALLGGLDLGATLQAGRPVARQGVLAQADGGVVLLAMAERVEAGTAARLAAVMDSGFVRLERDGIATQRSARLGVVALDEGIEDDERPCAALMDRLAFRPSVGSGHDCEAVPWRASEIAAARDLLPQVRVSPAVLSALCEAAGALGVDSMRGPLLALRAARAAAALAGDTEVGEEHAAMAARLVLAPRATRLPQPVPQEAHEQAEPDQPPQQQDAEPPASDADAEPPPDTPPGDTCDQPPEETAQYPTAAELERAREIAASVLQAARAAIPPGLLAALKAGHAQRSRAQAAGRSGAQQQGHNRGRPVGARRGQPGAAARINIIETLRGAAPWQRLRVRQAAAQEVMRDTAPVQRRIHVRPEDFHVTRFRQLGQTTTVFVVDASGSSALHRLAEAKGAVELLLADCYVRRDRVAVLAFRGSAAELLLPPTRSLARARRSLAGLPGGGGTPMAAALDAAGALAEQISRRGETPVVVLLTDGRANVGRGGVPGRAKATEDAMDAARQLRRSGVTAMLLDTSPQPQEGARSIAREMGAVYVPLPHAGAQAVSQAVRAVTAAAR